MTLTEKLWQFWGKLNMGKIDWQFINDDSISNKEKNKAREMVISRGFVNIFSMDEFPKSRSGYWNVVCGCNMNPCFDGKRWYFTSAKYASDYARYLYRNGKINKFHSVAEA